MVDNIKIPTKHYVGMVKRNSEKIPMGFITPWGNDSAAKKRMATVDSWTRKTRNKPLPTLTIDNVPMNGFKMTTDIRSSNYGGSDQWRIEDPRGFELEISSGNLAQLLSVGMIDRGEIVDTCVWARLGQQNILLSTATEEYKNALNNTAVAAMSASWKDVKIGNTVLLQNNVSGVWLGRMHGLSFSSCSKDHNKNMLSVSHKAMHVIHINKPTARHQQSLLLASSPKLAAVTDTATITESQAETLANSLLNNSNCYTQTSGYNRYIALTIGAPKFGSNVNLCLQPLEIASDVELREATNGSKNCYVFFSTDQSLFQIRSNFGRGNTVDFVGYAYSKQAFSENKIVREGQMIPSQWGSGQQFQQKTQDHVFDKKDQFYAIVLNIKTQAGTDVQAFLH